MEFAAPRYTAFEWPRYRFVPGRNPHPTEHREGHSFGGGGVKLPPVEFVPPERWHDSPHYLYGCDLYNHGYWWEAHEAWEALWQTTDKSAVQGRFLQGLIQVSACHLKLESANERRVRSLLRSSGKYFDSIIGSIGEAAFMGLLVAAWHKEVLAYYQRILDRDPVVLCHDPQRYPYILVSKP